MIVLTPGQNKSGPGPRPENGSKFRIMQEIRARCHSGRDKDRDMTMHCRVRKYHPWKGPLALDINGSLV